MQGAGTVRNGPAGSRTNAQVHVQRRPRTRTAKAREFARGLRRRSTEAERRMWRMLRGRRFSAFKFRRQYPFGNYFLDFFCPEAGLAIELDGGVHGCAESRVHDSERDGFLKQKGIRVLRFWNHQMGKELELVQGAIRRALDGHSNVAHVR